MGDDNRAFGEDVLSKKINPIDRDYEKYLLAPWHRRDNLEYLYIECGYSAREMARMYGVNHKVILKWMKRFGIERRGPGGTWSKWNKRMYRNRFYLIQQYLTLRLSTVQIAKKENVYPSVIRHWLIKFDIPRRKVGRGRLE